VDLTGKASYTYTFNNTDKGIQNGRFSLRIGSSLTSVPTVDNSANNLKVYGDSRGVYVVSSEPVKQLTVFDLMGRKLYESVANAGYYPLKENLGKTPLIVKVTTANQVKTVKLGIK
jgi:hypothetical protein